MARSSIGTGLDQRESGRYWATGKDGFISLIVSDFDCEGEEIAHAFARSMRDDFGIEEIHPVKVALTHDQAIELDPPRALRTKKTSVKYEESAADYGDDVWEVQALWPEALQQLLRDSFDAHRCAWNNVTLLRTGGGAVERASLENWRADATLSDETNDITKTYGDSGSDGQDALARHLRTDPDLAAVVEAWTTLAEPIKAGILAMVKAAT